MSTIRAATPTENAATATAVRAQPFGCGRVASQQCRCVGLDPDAGQGTYVIGAEPAAYLQLRGGDQAQLAVPGHHSDSRLLRVGHEEVIEEQRRGRRPLAEPRQPSSSPLDVRILGDGQRGHARLDQRTRERDSARLFQKDGHLEISATEAAVLFGHGNAEQVHFRRPGPQSPVSTARGASGFADRVGRADLTQDVACRRAQRPLIFVES